MFVTVLWKTMETWAAVQKLQCHACFNLFYVELLWLRLALQLKWVENEAFSIIFIPLVLTRTLHCLFTKASGS